jgi:deazaflavin-dependent oxidoreductase (nitroreductase family)
MSFDTPAGTHGARQPRAGLMLRWVNKTAASRFRRTGMMMGMNGLTLTTVGARSGAERISPVGWWPGQDGSWLIVAAANGAARYHNIAARPDNVQIEVDGRRIGVTAEQLHRAEGAEVWRQIAAAAPRFAQYQAKTDRELPVIRLIPRSAQLVLDVPARTPCRRESGQTTATLFKIA